MGRVHRWGIIIAFAIIMICGWIAIKAVFIETKDVIVPSVIGSQLIDAVDKLQNQGLLAKIDKIDSPERADTVISQNIPEGAKVSKGKVLLLKVSKGGSIVPIPDVRGMKYEDGLKRLSETGFKVDKVLRVTDKFKPAGSIIAQNPAAPQTVAANAMVSLLVSSGVSGESSFVAVPDIIGKDLEMATQIIEQSGLAVGKASEAPSTSTAAGNIISMTPRKGASVPAGTLINFVLARTPLNDEDSSDTPPLSSQNKERDEVVRKVVIKEAIPVNIPIKTEQTAPIDKKLEAKKTEAKQVVASAQIPTDKKEAVPSVSTKLPKKIAKIRYQTPPLSKPLSLKIEITDGAGTKTIKDGTAKSGEYIAVDVPYFGTSTVLITLGGDLVWQDRFN